MTRLADRHVVLLLTGVMAAGKSTVSELLAGRFAKGVHVRGHAFHRMVVSGREEMTANPSPEAWRQLRLRYRLGAAAADTYFAAGFSVVVQDIVIGPLLREYVRAISSRPLMVVVLAPRPDVVARREAGRAKTGYAAGFTPHNLDEALRTQTPRIGLWLDSSDQTPEETVEAILHRAWHEGRIPSDVA